MDQTPNRILPSGFYLLQGADGTKLIGCAVTKALSKGRARLCRILEEKVLNQLRAALLRVTPRGRRAASCKPSALAGLVTPGMRSAHHPSRQRSIKLTVKKINSKWCKATSVQRVSQIARQDQVGIFCVGRVCDGQKVVAF